MNLVKNAEEKLNNATEKVNKILNENGNLEEFKAKEEE
jgi:exonuclease VII small subunit